MAYEIKFSDDDDFVHATITGENSLSNVQGYLADLLAECQRRDCFLVLIDERLEGPRLDVDQVFSIAADGAVSALGVFHAVAFVDVEMGEMAYFAENVAVNRGMPVRAFPSVAEAKEWLSAQTDDGEQHIFRDSD